MAEAEAVTTNRLTASVLKLFQKELDRAYAPDDLAKALKLQFPKDPQKQAQALQEITTSLNDLMQEGQIREVAPSLFKGRRFFDQEKHIEHAYLGGMGNTQYRFPALIFRLNIGVLSLFFMNDKGLGAWQVTVKDTTIGKDYCLTRRLCDGVYLIGSAPAKPDQENYLRIEGKYISKQHAILTISGEEIRIEDQNTLYGTRIDHFTKEGLLSYRQVAEAFLERVQDKDQADPVAQGHFVLQQLVKNHLNFESTFFSVVVNAVLLDRG